MNLICNLSDYNYNNVFFMEKRNNMLLSEILLNYYIQMKMLH